MRTLYYSLAFGLSLLLLAGCDKGSSDPQPSTTQPTTSPGVAVGQPISVSINVQNNGRAATTGGAVISATPFAKTLTVDGRRGAYFVGNSDLKAMYITFKKGEKVYATVFYSKVNAAGFAKPTATENLEAKVYKQYTEDPVATLKLDRGAFDKPAQRFTDTDGSEYVYSEVEVTL